jgi:tRNA dimethylallyltransferase
MNSKKTGKVLVIIGPTSVGKTDLSLTLAEKLSGEIISADSRLLYKGMDIGTAKPSKEERDRVPHHLIDVADPSETWSLARFNQVVIAQIEKVLSMGKLPIIVGGTGQYIRSLVEGWEVPEIRPDVRLRSVLENWGENIGAFELHHKMSIMDPESGKVIQPQNMRRTVRALEVMFITGKRFSDVRKKTIPKFDYKLIGLIRPRDELYMLIDTRIERMFEMGFVPEVEELLKKGYRSDLPSMSAIGYGEIAKFLQGEISLEEAKGIMKRKTRQFVRRQANWFKPDDALIEWFEMTPDPMEFITTSINGWLRENK